MPGAIPGGQPVIATLPAAAIEPPAPRLADIVRFTCNICGAVNKLPRGRFSREEPSCAVCVSSVRMRSVIRCLSLALFGRSLTIDQMPVNRKIRGIGLSDWEIYAQRLAARFSYRNTFFDEEPQLDITDPPRELWGTLDFVIASDVFEHVTPPVEAAFAGALQVLKPGGTLIFSVPYTLDPTTVEHFPSLHDFRLLNFGEDWYLLNQRHDGEHELFDRPVFHGGPGQTLEMRIFCQGDVEARLATAGFEAITIHDEHDAAVGVIHAQNWSLPMTARKPGLLLPHRMARALRRWLPRWRGIR